LFALEAGQILHNNVAAIDVEIALGLEPSQIARNQLAHGAEFGGEVLLGLVQFHANGIARSRGAGLREADDQRDQPLGYRSK